MPASPASGESLAAQILELISTAERALISLIVDRLRAGIYSDGWEAAKLAEVQLIRQRLVNGTQRLSTDLATQVHKIVLDAYNHGQALAVADLRELDKPWQLAPNAAATAQHLADDVVRNVHAAVNEVPGLLLDVYRNAVHAGVAQLLGGSVTRVQASQQVLNILADRGVTGFRDSAGRNWSLESYAEMAVRTGAGHAAVQGHVDSLAASGIDLVIVSDAPRECPLCRPWERKVLSISGQVGAIIEPSALTGRPVTVNVTASLATARAAGLQHPNCRHTLSAYTPGVTLKGTAESSPARYDAGQRQREIERMIRTWKRRQQVALDNPTARKAALKVRQWQATLRDHVDTNDLTRLRRREQIGQAI